MSSADDNAAESTPVLAIVLAVIALLGVSTTFIPASWLGDGDEQTEQTTAGPVAKKSSSSSADAADNPSVAVGPGTTSKPTADNQQNSADQAQAEKTTPVDTSALADTTGTNLTDTAQTEMQKSAAKDQAAEKPIHVAAPVADNSAPSTAQASTQNNVVQPPKPVVPQQQQQPAAVNSAMPPHGRQWRPPHLASQRDNQGFPMPFNPSARPGFPQPMPYPYAYPNPYPNPNQQGYKPYSRPPVPRPLAPAQPYMPGNTGR